MPSDLGRLIEFKVKTLLALSICATALTASVPAYAHHTLANGTHVSGSPPPQAN